MEVKQLDSRVKLVKAPCSPCQRLATVKTKEPHDLWLNDAKEILKETD